MPTLQRVCERAVARELVEPRSVCGVLQYADAAGAGMLRQHCLVRTVYSAGVACGTLQAGSSHAATYSSEDLQTRACSMVYTFVHPVSVIKRRGWHTARYMLPSELLSMRYGGASDGGLLLLTRWVVALRLWRSRTWTRCCWRRASRWRRCPGTCWPTWRRCCSCATCSLRAQTKQLSWAVQCRDQCCVPPAGPQHSRLQVSSLLQYPTIRPSVGCDACAALHSAYPVPSSFQPVTSIVQHRRLNEVPWLTHHAWLAAGEEGDGEEESSRPSLRSSPSKGAHLSGALGSAASFGSERSFKSEADATEDAAAFRQVSKSTACVLIFNCCCISCRLR